MLDTIRESLQLNQNLTEDFKSNLFELVAIFEKNYPNIPLDKLNDRLKTLNVKTVSKFLESKPTKYDYKTNTLLISKEKLKEVQDAKFLLMTNVLDMIAEENTNPLLEGFKEGYAELLANYLVGYEGDN